MGQDRVVFVKKAGIEWLITAHGILFRIGTLGQTNMPYHHLQRTGQFV